MRTFIDLLTSLAGKDELEKMKKAFGNKFVTTMPFSGTDKELYKERKKEYYDKHRDIIDKLPTKEEAAEYMKINPPPVSNQLRPELSKALGHFTLETLDNLKNKQNEFQGIKTDSNLTYGNKIAKGLFTAGLKTGSQGRAIYLNPTKNKQDILSTIVHEGNHAIEHYNPYINKTVQDFLNKKIEKEKSNLPNDYLPNLYKGIQDIIDLSDEFTKPYNSTKIIYQGPINKNTINPTMPGGNPLPTSLATNFNEIPAFALETLMRDKHRWAINQNTNDDSRKLLRRIMKEQQQQYRNLGLIDINKPLGTNTGYKYRGNLVQNYESPPAKDSNYHLVDQAFIDKIEKLRKPLERRKSFNQTTTTTTVPSQTLQNPITQAMTQNQSPYYGNQLTQLMQQSNFNKRPREDYDSENETDNPINKRNKLNPLLNTMTTTIPNVNIPSTIPKLNRRYSF